MCKKLLVLVLVLCFVGSALAITEYTYYPITGYVGSTCDPPLATSPDGLKFSTSFYAGFWTTCGGEYPCGMTGWAKVDIPNLGGEQIIKAELKFNHSGCQGTGAMRVRVNYVSDDSWVNTTVNNSHPATATNVSTTDDGGGSCKGTAAKVLDITSWFGAGMEPLGGGDPLSLQFNETPEFYGTPENPFDGWYGVSLNGVHVVITTPEPATIALLGLGVLALLRKRR